MLILNLKKILSYNEKKKEKIFFKINHKLNKLSTKKRITWSLENLPNQFILSSSFGIQSIVLLHLIIQQYPNIPIILIDTGYLFPETYRFIDKITSKFNLNLKVFRGILSPAWQEARYGKLWEKGISGINFYNIINKVHPMQIVLKKLFVNTWFSGLRKVQSSHRKKLSFFSINMDVFKILPILDWTNQDIHNYIEKYRLNYHPLQKKGYSSVGDIHTTICQNVGIKEEKTRFFGLKRECGLHEL